MKKIKVTVKLDFHYDFIDDNSEEETKKFLETVLEYGADATNSEIKLLQYQVDQQTI